MTTDYYHRGYGNYVIASGDCIVNFFGRFLKNHNDKNVFDAQKFKNFMMNNVNRLLYSFGSGLSRKSHTISEKRIDNISKVVDNMRNCEFTNESTIFVDSGGFQLCMGYVNMNDIPLNFQYVPSENLSKINQHPLFVFSKNSSFTFIQLLYYFLYLQIGINKFQ